MTTDPRTWTTEQLRDWLARDKGWKLEPYGRGFIWYPKGYPASTTPIRPADDHPIPDTLDAAASALPEGWAWTRLQKRWEAVRIRPGGNCLAPEILDKTGVAVPDTGDEKHARFLLAVLCRMAQKGEKRGQ